MKAIVFDTRRYDRETLDRANAPYAHKLSYAQVRLDERSAPMANGQSAVIVFVNDQLDAATLRVLWNAGVRLVALRCAGHDGLDLAAARALGLRAVNVPSYTPHAVAEYVFGMLLSLVRQIPRARSRVENDNFDPDGLVGTTLYGKTFGIVGLGQIGRAVAAIAHGMGCRLLGYDPTAPSLDLPISFLSLDELVAASHVISLHVPLTPTTRHMIDRARLELLQPGAFLVNTSRGALIDTSALIDCLKKGRLGGVALDVYEDEANVFYRDLSEDVLTDDRLARLLTFSNVLVTPHMAFLTREALDEIAETTLQSLHDFEAGQVLQHEVLR
jgi:D-lactate dehydrogenase